MELCESALPYRQVYVVRLHGLLNEEAHSGKDGRHGGDGSRWRFKHCRYVRVEGCKEARDAIAFVVALGLENSIVVKEWPDKVQSFDRWLSELEPELAENEVKNLVHVNPDDMKASKLAMAGGEA